MVKKRQCNECSFADKIAILIIVTMCIVFLLNSCSIFVQHEPILITNKQYLLEVEGNRSSYTINNTQELYK